MVPMRRPDLGGKVGEGADVVAEQRVGVGELGTGQLDAVAAVASEEDDHVLAPFPCFNGLGPGGNNRPQ
jgi:hypothetical protein